MGAAPSNALTKNDWDLELEEIPRRRESDRTMTTVQLWTLNHDFNSEVRLLSLPHLSRFGVEKLIVVLNKIKSQI